MSVETEEERIFQVESAWTQKNSRYVQKTSGLVLPVGETEPTRPSSTDSLSQDALAPKRLPTGFPRTPLCRVT